MSRRRGIASSRRLWILATVATAMVATVAGLVVGRTRAQTASVASARAAAALESVRAGDARRWATDELAEAERALREGEIERRRQSVRWWVPDYSVALEHWRTAETTASAAATLSVARRGQAERGARESIDAAADAIGQSTLRSRSIYPGSRPLAWLALARIRLTEARVHQREGDFTQAAARADQAFALTRRTDDHGLAAVSRYADDGLVETWQQWKRDTIAWSRAEKRAAVVVSKEEHRVTLYLNGKVHRVYEADLGFNWVADKHVSGDGATPEGRYRVVQEKRGGSTLYYKALLLDYPNSLDQREFQAARRGGVIPTGASIGGLIELHGEGGRREDWTKGCVALANRDMDELMRFVGNGTPVTIIGSDGRGALAAMANEARPGGLTR